VAQVTIAFDDYQSGSVPDICVFTGKPTADRMVLRTRIVERDPVARSPGPVLGFFSRVTLFENPRAARNLLVGRHPVDARHLARRQRSESLFRVGGWVGLVLLVVAALAAQVWSPVLAIVSVILIIVSIYRRADLLRDRPVPTLIGAGTRVHLANVHPDFVNAVPSFPRG
jgi:hypothetical protein